ncbi:MAG: hypothetical protein ALECFALPRED_002342 [Alectoria fallacina]|uniref:Uncharacterized protein n=1 Tax=Alectoria fallacina TaxID=1903189 RepID=A0A8H3ICQ7_9LECA|nr:MAG: hypothetical protein ALECFALPRED_002342 [Alectoria fallacina]
MSQPPLRNRPNLRLALTDLTGSPRQSAQSTPLPTSRFITPYPTPGDTPFAKTAYSPYYSAGLKAPTVYETPESFTPRHTSRSCYGNCNGYRFKSLFASKPVWLLLMVVALALWWFNGGSEEMSVVKLGASGLGKEFLHQRKMHDYQFYPASNPKIHITQRWNIPRPSTGVYFDITIKNTTTLLLALHNAPEQESGASSGISEPPALLAHGHRKHYSFHPIPGDKAAPPVSLLAEVDDQEYILLPHSSSLVTISSKGLDERIEHHVRVVAPMADDHGLGVVELEGLWLSKGGKLVKVAGTLLSEDYVNEDLLNAENDQVGERHRTGLNDIEKDGTSKSGRQKASDITEDDDLLFTNQDRKKLLEVITDSPGSFTGKQQGRRTGGADGLLSGVMGWEYLLGEMFGADHVGIGVDGMCLMPGCIGGSGEPAGMGDVFFRSGPYGSAYFERSWMFSAYVPDVLVINIGGSDDSSFNDHTSDYNKTLWDLSESFETTYVSLIKAIRGLAYPKHPSILQSEKAGTPGIVSSTAPAAIPIFVMRPLRGQLEQATQNAVAKVRAGGDKAVFWLDTSGWLDTSVDDRDGPDFFYDDSATFPKWRLTVQGNQRVAIFLHMHVCRYLAGLEDKCAFLPHEVYQGKVFDPEMKKFDKYIEDEKERKLKKIFWEKEGVQ